MTRGLSRWGLSEKANKRAHTRTDAVNPHVTVCGSELLTLRQILWLLAALFIAAKMLLPLLAACSVYVGTVLSVPVTDRDYASTTPTVAVKNGTYSGIYSNEYDQDFFLGMPYAQVCCLRSTGSEICLPFFGYDIKFLSFPPRRQPYASPRRNH